ncbi:NAD-dependent epimerase/dehydratase family protein [Cohnella suwonensis]|uniref:NAD-dependent epimerase/dehydratase family protein n=1 Tax=Cohnella suwonensis TaxID=696072 RepID=A0ABW0LU95_9BACL
MRVLITGGYGFIGSFVAERFYQEGCEITIIDNLSTGNRSNVEFKHHSYALSIEDKKCEEVFKSNRFDVVVHLAAQVSVATSVENPRADTKSNVLGLTNMLSLSEKYGVKKFIMASSAAVYGSNDRIPLGEDEICDPLSPYGMSKWVGELYCDKWQKMYGLETLCFRFSNVYGPRQRDDGEGGVVSIFLGRILSNKELTLFGDGNQTRDFIYVGDVADAIYRASYSALTGVYNLSSSTESSINELVGHLQNLAGSVKTTYKDPRPGDIYRSKLDNSKIRHDLDWAPRYSLQDGLVKTIEWMRNERTETSHSVEKKKKETSLFVKGLKAALPYVENFILFAIVAWLSSAVVLTQNEFVDFKLFYIIVMGIIYGNRQAILSVALSIGLYTYELLGNGRELISLLYDTDFFFRIAIYLFVGLVVGYTVERKSSRLLAKQRQLEAMEEKHAFLSEVYNETRQVKEELQQQILNSGDSFGKIYSVTKRLESLEPEQIFTSTVSVVESIMRTEAVSIYTVNRYGSYLRLVAKSGGDQLDAPKSMKVEDYPYIQNLLENKEMFINKKLEGGLPLLVAPVMSNGNVLAVIALHQIQFENFNLYHHNLFKVTVELISTALSRALMFVEATMNQRYIEGTSALKPEVFKEILNSKAKASQKHGVKYVLLTPSVSDREQRELSEITQIISRSLRETDYIGLGDNGEILVLLANSSREDANFVLQRFNQNGIKMNFVDEGLQHVG